MLSLKINNTTVHFIPMTKPTKLDHSKYNQIDEDIEDYGYNIKNVKRSGKKKVTRFKEYKSWEEDSY